MKLLVSSNVNADSRIIINRNIMTRVQSVMPYLTYESDPYMTIVDGKLYWIIDAYTTSSYYPYSEPYSNEINTTNTSSATQLEKSSMETYAATVNSYIDEGNYTKALDKLEEWKNLAATIDARSKLEQEMHRNGEDSQEQN